MNDVREEIASLIKHVAKHKGYERAAICAVDCLLQWRDGKLENTVKAWFRSCKDNSSGTSENRHGAWVPAIPL